MEAWQHAQLREWIAAKWRHGPCPICQTDNWSVEDDLAQLMVYPNAAQAFPALIIRCTNCGHMLLINAITAGITTSPSEGPLAPSSDPDADRGTESPSDESEPEL